MHRSRPMRVAGAVVGFTAAAAVVAMAARAPLSGSTPVDAASARAPVTALGVLLLGAGIVAIAGCAALLWPRRRRQRDDEPVPEPLRVSWLSKLVAIVLPLVFGAALVAAALLGLRTVQRAPRLGGEQLGPSIAAPAARRATGSGFAVPAWLPWIVLVVAVVAAAAGLTLLVVRRRQPAPPEPSDRTTAGEAIGAAIGALGTATDPRAGVIAAYVAMEALLAASGVVRSPAEAPREYLRRVLVASSPTERDVSTLTGLFEQARFSPHPISERVRVLALSALSSLLARLQVGGAG